jgi:hypothetical protein
VGFLNPGTAVRAVLLAGSAVLGMATRVSAQTEVASLEYQVKAAYLLNFTRYVEWPRPLPPDASLVLCIMGDDPFGPALDQALAGRRSQGRAISLQRVRNERGAQGCHLVFLADGAWSRRRALIDNLTGSGILTVGDSDQFARSGGVIGFVISNETVRFVVNLNAMERSGLRISSRMLSLAMELQSTEGPRF